MKNSFCDVRLRDFLHLYQCSDYILYEQVVMPFFNDYKLVGKSPIPLNILERYYNVRVAGFIPYDSFITIYLMED